MLLELLPTFFDIIHNQSMSSKFSFLNEQFAWSIYPGALRCLKHHVFVSKLMFPWVVFYIFRCIILFHSQRLMCVILGYQRISHLNRIPWKALRGLHDTTIIKPPPPLYLSLSQLNFIFSTWFIYQLSHIFALDLLIISFVRIEDWNYTGLCLLEVAIWYWIVTYKSFDVIVEIVWAYHLTILVQPYFACGSYYIQLQLYIEKSHSARIHFQN